MEKKYIFHKSVRGYLHIKKELGCEDASASLTDEQGRYYIAVAADGHGDPACSRSDIGSRTAADTALECLRDFAESILQEEAAAGELEILKIPGRSRQANQLVKRLTDSILFKWHQRVMEQLDENPLTEEELQKAGGYEERYRKGEMLDHIYGTTLIAGLWVGDVLVLIQQGDGRCVVFYDDGSVEQPIPWDDRCFENETTSMCDSDAAESIRHCVIDTARKRVAACYMGSDGVEDSYRTMEGTHTFYRMLSCELLKQGADSFEAHLEEDFSEFSRKGSGDDVTVSGIVDLEVLLPLQDKFVRQMKQYELTEQLEQCQFKINSMSRKHDILKQRYSDAEAAIVAETDTEPESEECGQDYTEARAAFEEYDEKYGVYMEQKQKLLREIANLENPS